MIALVAFAAGAILMSLEILGSRILAPQYGNSVVVWASLIGVFMAALSTGYWLGGTLADRWPRRSGVGVVIAIAGILVTLIPVTAPFVFAIAGDALRRGSLVAAMGLFFLPTTLMGAVSPYAIRLPEFTAGRLGRTAGRLYAISTVGSILGFLGGLAWAIASFLVVPVVVAEDLGPVASIKRSAQLIKSTWGTSLRTTLRFGFIQLGLILIVIIRPIIIIIINFFFVIILFVIIAIVVWIGIILIRKIVNVIQLC